MASGRLGKGGKGRPRQSTPAASLFAGATYTVTNTGWLVAGHVFPQGQVPAAQGVVFQGISTQNHVLKTWSDGSAKHVLLIANMASTGDKTLELGTAATGSFVATAPTLTVEATPEGLPTRTATFTDTTYTNARFSGPLCKETRQVVSFTSSTGALAQVRAWFYLMSFSDGTHRVRFVLDNTINHVDSYFVPATVVMKVNGAAVATHTNTVTAGSGTLSHGGGYGFTTTSAHGLARGDYARVTDSQGDHSYSQVWDVTSTTTVNTYGGFDNYVAASGNTWSKVTFVIPWGGRGTSRFNVGGHAQAKWQPDLETFHAAQALYRVDPTYGDKTYSQTMTIAASSMSPNTKVMSADDFGIYRYGMYIPQIPPGGQRPELTVTPEWVMQWYRNKNVDLYDWMLTHADRAAETGFHLTKSSDGSALKLSDQPTFYYPGSYLGKQEKAIVIYAETNGGNGQAHQGGYFFVPYLVTGDWFYEDEMIQHAAFGVRNQGTGNNNRGDGSGWLFGMGNGLRSGAWAATKIAECIAYLPDTQSAWVTEFETIVSNNNTKEDYYIGIEPDTTIGHSIMVNDRLREGNTTEIHDPPHYSVLSNAGQVDQMFQAAYVVIASDHARRLGVTIFSDYRVRFGTFWTNFVNQVDVPKKGIYAFQFFGMPFMVDGGSVLTHASMQAFLDYNETNHSSYWNPVGNPDWGGSPQSPLFNAAGDYSMYLRAILAVATRDGISGALTALNAMEAWTDTNGNYTTRWAQGGDGFALGLSNLAFQFASSEGYRS